MPLQVAALLSRHRCVQVLDLSGLTCGLHDAGLLSRIAPCLPHLTQLSFTAGACVAECHTMEHVLSIISAQLPALKSLHLHGVLLTGEQVPKACLQSMLALFTQLDAHVFEQQTCAIDW